MTRADKQVTIDALTAKFSESTFFYVTDTSGLTVEQINKLRRICFDKGIKLQVAKNTLIKKALVAGGKYSDEFEPVLHGTSAIMFSQSGNIPAKVIKDFRGDKEIPKLKAAFIDSALLIGDNQIDTLVALKSKEELIGEIIGLLQSPAKNVISALKSSSGKLAGIVKALEQRAN